MPPEQIITELSDRVLTITLNRPDRLNAWTKTMFGELLQAFDRADADDEVRAVIVTGAGRAFCAGADLERGGDTFARPEHQGQDSIPRDGGGRLTLRIFDSTKPVIAAINGPAVGVGATMTLPMDVRLAADDARIGFVFARRGIVPEACPHRVTCAANRSRSSTGSSASHPGGTRTYAATSSGPGSWAASRRPWGRAVRSDLRSAKTVRTGWTAPRTPRASAAHPGPSRNRGVPREAVRTVPGQGERRVARRSPRLERPRVQLRFKSPTR
ncbi:MAG TPA: enoyl-CoA hydratase-related protein [Solirubrobacteraceae bacterium]|nr:enoyl-CoA hydratase-related protein [Solirubrobacteraceae bacterium]